MTTMKTDSPQRNDENAEHQHEITSDASSASTHKGKQDADKRTRTSLGSLATCARTGQLSYALDRRQEQTARTETPPQLPIDPQNSYETPFAPPDCNRRMQNRAGMTHARHNRHCTYTSRAMDMTLAPNTHDRAVW